MKNNLKYLMPDYDTAKQLIGWTLQRYGKVIDIIQTFDSSGELDILVKFKEDQILWSQICVTDTFGEQYKLTYRFRVCDVCCGKIPGEVTELCWTPYYGNEFNSRDLSDFAHQTLDHEEN